MKLKFNSQIKKIGSSYFLAIPISTIKVGDLKENQSSSVEIEIKQDITKDYKCKKCGHLFSSNSLPEDLECIECENNNIFDFEIIDEVLKNE